MEKGRVGEESKGKEMDGYPLTLTVEHSLNTALVSVGQ
jgi:hypothetical protein